VQTSLSRSSALYIQLAQTPSCGHLFSAAYPVRDCAWCQVSEALDRYENDQARLQGQPVPNVIGSRS
jgi:hypothetical protein